MSETQTIYFAVDASAEACTSNSYGRPRPRFGYEDEEADKPIVEADHVHICRICNAQWV